MALVFNWWPLDVLLLLATLLVGLYLLFTVRFTYWSRRGVRHMKPTFPLGNLHEVIVKRRHIGLFCGDVYKGHPGEKYVGIFQTYQPTLLLRDLDVIKTFLVKEFPSFDDRGFHFDEKNDPLSANLFLLAGQKWKNMRTKLTPTFTSGKMKMMFATILECGLELAECIRAEVASKEGGVTVEVKDLVARYSTDVIASCAFGIQCNCLRDPDAEFRRMGESFFQRQSLEAFGNALRLFAPGLAAILKVGRTRRNISDFFRRIVRETVGYREENKVVRNDFMHLLIQLKNNGFVDVDAGNTGKETPKTDSGSEPTQRLTIDEVAAQAFIFFLAGFETSSTTVSFCLFELASNPDIQTRLRDELEAILKKHGGSLTYDAMLEMEYLAMVIDETLRKYPPLPLLNRKCKRKFVIPETGLVVEPETQVIVPVLGIHHDPEYYPDPEKFDPERFTKENKARRHGFSFLPFGEGPRICIGMRFGYMQTKVALVSLLSNYLFSLSQETKIPLVLNESILIMTAKEGIYLNVKKRS